LLAQQRSHPALLLATPRQVLSEAAGVLIAIVFVEVFIILANRWRCPLTDIAARYTEERQDNFDIYLPLWLARYNKQIFGSLFFASLLYTLARWQGWIG
jgi:hypothetical protein